MFKISTLSTCWTKRKRLNKIKFKNFFQKTERLKKNENASKKRGKTSTLNIRKCLKNIRKSLNFFQFWGISQNKMDIPQNWFLRHFNVETFPCWGVSIAPGGEEDDPNPYDIRPTDDVTKRVCGMLLPLCCATLTHGPSGKIS